MSWWERILGVVAGLLLAVSLSAFGYLAWWVWVFWHA